MKFPIKYFLLLMTGAPYSRAQVPVTIESIDSLRDVTDPKISPDGQWVSYTVSYVNHEKDYYTTDLWMSRWDGQLELRLTHTPEEDESTARWSPDNRYLAFLSSRKNREEDEDETQLWLLNRQGGEAEKITDYPGGVEDYCWSPDGKKLALILNTVDSSEYLEGTETTKPIVIDRYYFKEDYSGYLTTERKQLYLFDLQSRDTFRVLSGDFEEQLPSWSPDGKWIAFVSKRSREDWDTDNNYDIYITEPRRNATAIQLTKTKGADGDPSFESYPAWSPDSKYIAYFQGGPPSLIYYGTQHLTIVPVSGGSPEVLTASYDRNIWHPKWSTDGEQIYFLAEDHQNLELQTLLRKGGAITPLMEGRHAFYDFDIQPGKTAVLFSTPDRPYEVYALDEKKLRPLSHQNDSWIKNRTLGTTKEFQSRSKDGTVISGHMVLPAGYVEGKKYPAILQIHGGPTSQNQNEWYYDWQLYASWGYVLVSMNPRGSTGFGEKFATGIYADWGNKDAQDVLSGVDELVKSGIADPGKLALEGWSYGGILTNYIIAKDHRFQCAVSGAGISNIFAGFGTDMYIREYITEIGTPWNNFKTYEKLSHPFLHADQIKTPTLFMCGMNDFNVPLLNSEQMYQALRVNGVETQLIIYPGQYHGIDVPGYEQDRLQRRKEWFEEYLMK